jgi:hypothetical protein
LDAHIADETLKTLVQAWGVKAEFGIGFDRRFALGVHTPEEKFLNIHVFFASPSGRVEIMFGEARSWPPREQVLPGITMPIVDDDCRFEI